MAKGFKEGFIQIYTGDGKGKTTAALGLALRAAGHGLRTYIAQFMKGQRYGELISVRQLPEITIEQFGKDTFIHLDKATPEDISLAQSGLERAAEVMQSGKYHIIILDEINVAIYFKLLSISEVIDFIHKKPRNIELILTGRKAPQELIEIADLVTEMLEVKHYYQKNIPSREGIER